MKNIQAVKRIYRVLVVVVSGLIINETLAQSNHQVSGLIQVKFKHTEVDVSNHEINEGALKSSALKGFLMRVGFSKGRRIFAEAQPNDTAGVAPDGFRFKKIDLSTWYLLAVNKDSSVTQMVDSLRHFDGIEAACPVTFYEPTDEPNDYYYQNGYQTGLKNPSVGKDIHAVQAWTYSTGRSDLKVAVVDGGVDYTHPDLDPGNRSRVLQGYDAADGDNDPMDDISTQYPWASHGTSVAGVIGARTNNGGTGIAGILWNCSILPVKVAATNGPWWDPFSWTTGSAIDPWIASGINWAAGNGARVINLSLGGYSDLWSQFFFGNPVGEAAHNAYSQGILVVAASGNDNSTSPFYPASWPFVMAVGATDQNDNRASFSNYGNYLDIVAPGGNFANYSTKRSNQYNYFAGTSCAAPMVTGSAGLVFSLATDRGIPLSNDDVKHLLEASADKVPGMGGQNWTQEYGFGRVNVARALQHLVTPYVVSQGSVTSTNATLVLDYHTHTFYNNGGLATGAYFGTKQYKVTAHVTFPNPYREAPYVWCRERGTTGWDYANGCSEWPWTNITNVTATGFDVETVIYYVGQRPGEGCVCQYWPGNSSTAQATIAYTVVGRPGNLIFVPQDYSTVSAALSAATSGQTVIVSNGSYAIESDITIRAGVTLQLNSASLAVAADAIMIMYAGSNMQLNSSTFSFYQLGLISGATINSNGSTIIASGGDLTIPSGSSLQATGSTFQFAAGRKLRVQGTLVTSGPNTFTSISGQWYGIEYYNTPGGNALYNATIQNAQYGLFIYNSYVDVMGCLIQWNSTGIYTSCNSIAVRYNQLENNSVGVDCAYYGSPVLAPSNRFREMDFAVRCDGTSQPYLGSTIGYNSLYWNGWDIFSSYPGSIWAWGNWWGSYPADPWVYGNVDWSNALQLDPNPQKIAVREHPSIASPTISVSAKDTVGLAYYEGLRLKALANTSATITTDLQTLIGQHPDELSGRMALFLWAQIQEKQGADVNSLLMDVESKYTGRAVARIARQLQVGRMVKAGDYKGAFSLARSVVQAGDTLSLKQAIYDAGSLAWYYLDDKSTGGMYFERLANEYPTDPLAYSALAAIGQASAKSAVKSQTSIEKAAAFELGANYPNPFNPSTRINYSVAEHGFVSLIIYDVLGREITTLANGNQQVGHYTVNWNSQSSGIPVSSGMYFARLRVLNELGGVKFAKTIKLLLTK